VGKSAPFARFPGTLANVSDETRAPVAIRSIRPYATVEEFLAEERDTLSRTAVTLIGAPSRPRGVVIRFELTLQDGSPLVRGEGRVLAFQAADDRGPSSLTLRFTRLDAKSKALVDRAAEARGESSPPPAPPTPAPSPRPSGTVHGDVTDPLASTMVGETLDPSSASGEVAISSGHLPLSDAEDVGAAPRPVPEQRDALLDRLRVRAKSLSPHEVAKILSAPRARNS